MKRKYLYSLLLLFFSVVASAQNATSVTGTVTEKGTGLPMPGVNVIIKGSNKGTTTDFDGNYSLDAQKGQVLVFSYIGFKNQEITVGGGKNQEINVLLVEDAQELEDVVVIGYGVAKKKDVTGSVNLVSEKDFNKAPAVNADQLLQGKVAGVQMTSAGGSPGEGQVIRVRGNGSLSLTSNPLIVIDGVPMSDGGVGGSRSILNSINPDDIASMTVLKDASSTAIFGSRAANGVIMITTKKGRANQDMKINFNTSLSIQSINDNYVDMMNASEFRAFIEGLNKPEFTSRLGNASTDWQKEIYQLAPMSNSSLSISGATGFLPYRVSVGHSYADGILKTDNFKRTVAKITLTPSFLDNSLKLEMNANGSFMQNRFANRGAIGSAVKYDPTQPIYDPNSKFGGYSAWMGKNPGELAGLAPKNPLALLNLTNDTSKEYRFIGNLKADYTLPFFSDITATLNVGLDYNKGKGNEVIDPSMPDYSSNFNGFKKNYNSKLTNKLLDFYLNYNKEINNHNFGLMTGYSYQSFEREGDEVKNYYFVNPGDNIERIEIGKSKSTLISFFGRANYSYKEKYLLTATLRADASSKLAKEHRWGYFPSVALAWNITKEDFLSDSETVNELKLRLGYGEVGNVNGLGDYLFLTNYVRSVQGAYYRLGDKYYQTYRPSAFNREIRWEIGNTLNAGIDFTLWNHLVSGTLDVYKKVTKDLIASSSIDAFTNFSDRLDTNIGNMENKGVELGLMITPIRKDDFRWSINYNVSYNDNKITKMPDEQATGGIDGGTDTMLQLQKQGYTPFSFNVYQQVYNEQGKPLENVFVDRNKDGAISAEDLYLYKSPFAPVSMGLGTDLNYKNWDLNITTRANIGNYVYNNVQVRLDQLLSVTDGDILSNIKANYSNTSFINHSTEAWLSDYYVENASFFKLDNITLGYTFSNTDKMNIRLYGTVQNILTITKYSGVDPEVYGGIDNNFYPRPQTYLVGLNINF